MTYRILLAAAAFIVAALMVFSMVGKPITCTPGETFTVGQASSMLLFVFFLVALPWLFGYACGDDDATKRYIERHTQSHTL